MARLTILFAILALSVPLFAINCYENGQRKDCGGSYCATQVVHKDTTKTIQLCGNSPVFGGGELCPYPANIDGTQTSCCTWDYCNSSKSVGTFLTFIVSCIALIFTKI